MRPFFSSDCSVHTSCLQCLSDASCGWYSNNNTCVRRDNSAFSYSGENVYVILNATFCDTCAQYIDCTSCMNVRVSFSMQNYYLNLTIFSLSFASITWIYLIWTRPLIVDGIRNNFAIILGSTWLFIHRLAWNLVAGMV